MHPSAPLESRYINGIANNTKKQSLLTDDFSKNAKVTLDYVYGELKSDKEYLRLTEEMTELTKEFNPHVYFLGTTCMMPTTYRNNSSILLHEQNRKLGI